MAQDSLGKKTHLPCVLYLFWNADKIWDPLAEIDRVKAPKILKANEAVSKIFSDNGWPFDVRSRQAYVNRFFRWLSLDPAYQTNYPTRLLSASDSVALRQSLWIDFVFGTPEAQRAIEGLREVLEVSKEKTVEISPKTHEQFCDWVGISKKDNTRRGPFARWLEDVGLAIPLAGRRSNETSIVVDLSGGKYATSEAFVYGLLLEFGQTLETGSLEAIEIKLTDITECLTVKSLMVENKDVLDLMNKAETKGHIRREGGSVIIDLDNFGESLKAQAPFPSQDWVLEESSIDDPLDRQVVDELSEFPEDDCTAEEGDPFDTSAELESVKRTIRSRSFSRRVSAAYRYRCCIEGLRFRSPSRTSWYGDAAHIIPNSGKARDGSNIYGRPIISNGLFLAKFMHWCFDRGWLTLVPVIRKGKLKTYKISVATAALDDFFKEEAKELLKLDEKHLPPEWFPANRNVWPSTRALEWHKENVFDG